MSAASATLIVCGPRWATVPIGESGYAGTRPKLGFRPKLPQKPAGMRTLPAPSVPTESGPMPEATAAAVPPEEPPGVFCGFQGLRVMPVSGELVSPLQPNSGVVALARIRSLIDTGTPSRSPAGALRAQRASLAVAARRASSAATTQKALRTGL